jgi:hypothetical protein
MELAAASMASLPIPTPPCPTKEAEEAEVVDWADADDIEDEPQPAIDEEEAEKPAGLAIEINSMTSTLLLGASSVSMEESVRSSDAKREAASIYPLQAGSTKDAPIRSLHAESNDGTPPATSIHPLHPKGPAMPKQPRATTQLKLKSVLVLLDREPPSPLHHRKPIWRRLDLAHSTNFGSSLNAASHSKRPSIPTWKGLNSDPGGRWERGKPSCVNEM